MKKKTLAITAAVVALLAGAVAAAAWRGLIPLPPPGPPQKDMAVDAATSAEVVRTLVARLDSHYVFPDKAKALGERLRAQQARYDKITSAESLAEALTDDMRELVHDGHLEVRYSEKDVPADAPETADDDDTMSAEEQAEMLRHNYGYERLERLSFNIGYLQLSAFAPDSGTRMAAAMTLLGDTRGLIIDLRGCRGGSPNTVAALASYFFERRTHLNDFVGRDGQVTKEMHTSEQVAGRRYPAQRKVYILTDDETFSAAEDFTYAMKNLKRATIVGTRTGGGAHPGRMWRLGAHFAAFVPSGRSQSPITHADWEGTGVEPDVKTSAGDALDAAQVLILKDSLVTETDEAVKGRMARRIKQLS